MSDEATGQRRDVVEGAPMTDNRRLLVGRVIFPVFCLLAAYLTSIYWRDGEYLSFSVNLLACAVCGRRATMLWLRRLP